MAVRTIPKESKAATKEDHGGHSAWSEEKERLAFGSIPPIDTAAAKRLLPDLVDVCEMLGHTQSISWDGVCTALSAEVSQLSPRDLLEICPSIEIPGSTWCALLHPGSVNTSGLLKVQARSLEMIYERQHRLEVQEAIDAHKIMRQAEGRRDPAKWFS